MVVCPACGRENPEGFQYCGFCRAPLAIVPGESRQQRKTVTVLFCDVTRSTELGESTDPEALRALLARYFERMKAIVESHGGSVEKFIGDAVMAVFGVPVVHEDDALRACRAAVEMRDAFPDLGISGRIGVNTGEVVTGTEERLATGDPVNVAARLQQAAQPGELLIGAETLRLTRSVVEAEPVEPLALKGKAEPVPAHRLLSVAGDGFARRGEAPMVGRQGERRLLADAWERVLSERSCHLFTILGPAGVGKSRLASEFLSSQEGLMVRRGRCLPYGEGITYWPVVEVLKQLPAVDSDEAATATMRGLLGDEELVASSEEIAWAFRKTLEAVASEQPFVCLFDDLHWGEETFLDLVEHVADLSRDAPILLLCMARPDLLDRRSGWGGGKVNATTVLLEPLAPEETELLLESLAELDADVRARITAAAEGNPLFVEEMVAMLRDSPDGEVAVPPTIQALLAARLDQLNQSERDVLQCGSVEGRVFHRGAVQALAPDEGQVSARLTGLVRKELVRPDKPQLPGEDAFRFRHLLIRDAAYDALPKSSRAELHERFATWLEKHGANLVELDEVLGFHLEQAYRYRGELGLIDERTRELGRRAAARLAASAAVAHARTDMPAAANMFERAASLLPTDDQARLELLPMLGDALMHGGNLAGADNVMQEVLDRARTIGSKRLEAHARIRRSRLVLQSAPEQAPMDEVLAEAERTIDVFAQSGDDLGLAYAWHLAGLIHTWSGQAGHGEEAFEHAVEHAQRAGARAAEAEGLIWLALSTLFGPTPAEDGIRRCQEIIRQADQNPYAQAHVLVPLGVLQAMCGHIDEGRQSIARGRAVLFDLGLKLAWGGTALPAAEVELIAGDAAAAERMLGESYEQLEKLGDKGYLASIASTLAEALHRQGREAEAERYAIVSKQTAASDDLDAQATWRAVMAKILARRGRAEDAERLAREALALLEGTDMLKQRADANESLAEVLRLSARRDLAASALTQAIRLHEQKGNLPAADRARRSLDDLQEPAAPS